MPDSPQFDAFGASGGGFRFTTTCQSAEASIITVNPA